MRRDSGPRHSPGHPTQARRHQVSLQERPRASLTLHWPRSTTILVFNTRHGFWGRSLWTWLWCDFSQDLEGACLELSSSSLGERGDRKWLVFSNSSSTGISRQDETEFANLFFKEVFLGRAFAQPFPQAFLKALANNLAMGIIPGFEPLASAKLFG